MKVSVVIPCHNAAPYLAQTIGSVLAQSEAAAEIIVVDDHSSDTSLVVAQGFIPRVRVVEAHHGSASATRNHGAALASGDALMFLDADDVLGPDTLAALVTSLHRYPGAIALCPWYRLEEEDGRWRRRPPSCEPRRAGQDLLDAWLGGWYHPPCSVLWSRAALQAVGDWDPRGGPNDDGYMMLRAMALGIPLVPSSEGEVFYRRLSQSLSGTRYSEAGLRARIWVMDELARLLAEGGRLKRHRRHLAMAYDQLARDASGAFPALARRCRDEARRLGGVSGWRALQKAKQQRFRGLRHGLRALYQPLLVPPPATATGEEIRHGLELPASPLPPIDPAPSASSDISISVIIPTYNRARLLPRALDSVLAQHYQNLEILVVDDGSSDDTRAVVMGYAEPRLRYLRQPTNLGAAAARNRGLREARGDFIALLDSDDEWLPGKLALQLALFQRLPARVGMIYTGSEAVDSQNRRRRLWLPTARGDIQRWLLEQNILHGAPSNALLRRAVVERIGGFDEAMPAIEDYDYWLRLGQHYQVDFVAAPLSRYHDPAHPDGDSDARRLSHNLGANLRARRYLHQKHRAAMNAAGVEHRFLLETARRHLKWNIDTAEARRLILQAIARGPLDWRSYPWLLIMLLPYRSREWLRGVRRQLLMRLSHRDSPAS